MLKRIAKTAGIAAIGYVIGLAICFIVGFIAAVALGPDNVNLVALTSHVWWIPYITMVISVGVGIQKKNN